LFLKNIIAYSGANLLSQFLQAVEHLVIRRILAPALMGTWNRVLVLQNFIATFDPGITQAASRELPLLRGAGKREEEETVRSTAGWARVAQGLIFSSGIVLFALMNKERLGAGWLEVAFVAAVLVSISSCSEIMTVFYQSAQRYVTLSRSIVTAAVIELSLVPIGAFLYGVRGMMAGFVVAATLQSLILLVMARSADAGMAATFEWPVARRLISFGLPLRVVDYPLALLLVMDSMCVARFCSAAQLALYGTAQMLFALASDVPGRVAVVLLSRLYTLSGQKGERSQRASELRQYFVIQHALFMPFVITTIWWAAQFIILFFLPTYSHSLDVAQVLLVGVYFVPSSTLIRNFWVIDKRLGAILLSNIGGLMAGLVAMFLACEVGQWQLRWIAFGIVAAYALHYSILLFSVGRGLWGGNGAMMVGAWALIGSGSVAVLLDRTSADVAVGIGANALFFRAARGWATTQFFLLPLYGLSVWRGSVWKLCLAELLKLRNSSES
jgi:O-antigen/teichoic acid export membrane protein